MLGGLTGYHIERESIVGVASEDVGRVAIVGDAEPLSLRPLPGLAWRVFTAGPFDGRGHDFATTADWRRCSGGRIGAVVTIRFPRPISLAGEFPFSWHDEKSRSAYVAGRYRVAADGVTQLDVYVDANLGRVVGIEPMGDEIDVHSHRILEGPRPAGGPDETENC